MKIETKNPNFEYVVACNKLCGSGHYNMKKKLRIVTQKEYDKWFKEQKSYYLTVVKPTMGNDTLKTAVKTELEDSKANL